MSSSLPSVLVDETQPGPLLTFQQILFRTHERADFPHASELATSILFFLMWVSLRKAAFTGFLLRWARQLGAPDEVVEYKWSVLVWNGIFHTWSTLWLLDWLPRHNWYIHTEYLWENIMSTPAQRMELEMKCFYMLQLGYHFQSIVWHTLEDRRPDFVAMMVHHFVTVALIIGSYLFNYCRIGMLVLLVHDSSDVMVCICKASHMVNWKKVSHTSFVFMFITWFYTRLYLFPIWVIGSCWSYPIEQRFGFVWFLFVSLMSILFVLHIYWFSLFVKIAMGILKHKSGEDITETKGAQADLKRSFNKKNADMVAAASEV